MTKNVNFSDVTENVTGTCPLSRRFYNLLRLSLGITQDFPAGVSAEEWQRLYEMSVMQSLVGVCYQGVSQLPPAQQPPLQLAMQWACEAEAIRGMNIQQNEEAARLTQLFAAEGRKTAILKGQANARLYPDKLSRTPGDIDIWVEGGRDSVIALLEKMGLMNDSTEIPPEHETKIDYHHIDIHSNNNGILVEVHFRPSSGTFSPFKNNKLQRWLKQELQSTTIVEEGFCIPSYSFALIMQLAHIQKHLIGGGIGLRQIVDYYWLLQNSTSDNLETTKSLLKQFGLMKTAQALMWVLQEIFHLEYHKMLIAPERRLGKWMLHNIMTGGNFGHFRQQNHTKGWKKIIITRWHHVKLMRFYFWENIWLELRFWWIVIKTMPARIKKRTISLRR